MPKRRRSILGGGGALLAMLVALVAMAAPDDGPSPAGKKILEVRIEGNNRVSENEIRGQLQTKAGQVYDRDSIQQDVRNVYSLGRFDVVEPRLEVRDDGIVLTYRVVERAQIDSIEYRGARSVKENEISEKTGLAPGQFIGPGLVTRASQDIADLYKTQGYYFVEVDVDQAALKLNKLIFIIREGPRVRVKSVQFRGNETYTDSRLSREIETKSYNALLALFTKGGTLDEQQLKADQTRLIQFFRDEGYLDVKVGYRLGFSDDKTEVVVTFVIDSGPRYKVGTVEFQGNTVFPVSKLRGVMQLQPGQYFTADKVAHDEKAIKDNIYGNEGYIYSQVSIRHTFADEPARLNLVVIIIESDQVTVGRIDIVGNDVTHEKVIRRALTLFPLQPYSVLRERESKQNLMNTGLFQVVEINPAARGEGQDRDVLVRVEEGKTTTFLVGVGVTSDQGILGNISIENRNFDLFGFPKEWKELFTGRAFKGAGQTLRVVAEPGTELNRFQVQFFEPYLFDQPVSLGTNLFFFTRPREAYDEQRIGYVVSLGRRLANAWGIEGAVRIEGVDIGSVDSTAPSDIMDDAGSHVLIAGKFTIARDTTDSRFLPTKGDRLSFSVEPAGGTDTFVTMITSYRVYRTVRTDVFNRKSTVGGRVSVGYIAGDAPIYERFYAGGINTMRGFAFRGVGPVKGVNDDPIGGHLEVLASGEYSFPLWGKSRGAIFLDTGTVEEDLGMTTYRASVGFEVRIPIDFFGSIPLTFGVGVPIAKGSGDETQLFHFLFGTSF